MDHGWTPVPRISKIVRGGTKISNPGTKFQFWLSIKILIRRKYHVHNLMLKVSQHLLTWRQIYVNSKTNSSLFYKPSLPQAGSQ